MAKFLTTLFEERQQVVILSGDIHYSSVAHLSYARTHSKLQSVLVQLTASALKNEEILTRLIHTRLKDWLLAEKVRHWIGWINPANMVEISARQLHHNRQLLTNPDWHCVLEWIPRNRVQTFACTADILSLIAPWQRAKNAKWKWLQPLMLWKYRWFQDGREVVGLNNLALVHFDLADGHSSCKVIQDLYWFSGWYPTQIVYSRFESQLTPNQSLLR